MKFFTFTSPRANDVLTAAGPVPLDTALPPGYGMAFSNSRPPRRVPGQSSFIPLVQVSSRSLFLGSRRPAPIRMSSLRQLFVDDRDPSIIYSQTRQGTNDWSPWLGSVEEFMNTTMNAVDVGASAEITFFGSRIAVVGTISPTSFGPADPTTQYILDSGAPVSYSARPTDVTQYRVQFYESPPLNTGSHTLKIVIQSPGKFWLDYLVVTGNFSLSSGENNAVATSSGSTQPSTSSRVATPEPSATGSSTAPALGTSAGVIASGVLAGLIGLVFLILLAWYIRRKRFDKSPKSDTLRTMLPYVSFNPSPPSANQTSGLTSVTPFNLTTPTSFQSKPQPHSHSDSVDTLSGNTSGAGGSELANRSSFSTPIESNRRLFGVSQSQNDPPPDYSGS